MSRCTVGQEITPIGTYDGFKEGKFHKVIEVDRVGISLVNEDLGRPICIPDVFFLTRAEYEQAERKKDPFAPGKWVVCVGFGPWWMPGEIVQSSGTLSLRPEYFGLGDRAYRKSHFRPATPEEVKQQEQKAMNETKDDPAATERQTFTVCGREFYVGQRVWVNTSGGIVEDGEEIEVLGAHPKDLNYGFAARKVGTSYTCIIHPDFVDFTPPKPHEWKFGDWARHPEYGVGYVCEVQKDTGYSYVAFGGDFGIRYIGLKNLTYISTAEIPE